MRRGQHWTGFIAIGISLLALMVAIGGRHGETRVVVERAPAAQAEGSAPQQDNGGFRSERDQFGPRGFQRGFDGPFGDHHGWGFGPFMLIGGLFKLLFALALLGFGLRLLRGRRGWRGGPGWGGGGPGWYGYGPGWHGAPGHPGARPDASNQSGTSSPPNDPPAGDLPHTGSTTRL